MSRFRKPQRTKADKRAAAMQFVVMSPRSDAEKVASLVSSYGFKPHEAWEFVYEQKTRMLGHGVKL